MTEGMDVSLEPRVVPDPPLELVCTLANHAAILGHRLVCRRTFGGEALDYHLAIDRRTARKLDPFFNAQPFRRTRRSRHERVAVSYGGIADPLDGEIYLILSQGKSRLKQRVTVPSFVMMELAWVAGLSEHNYDLGRMVIEA